MKIIRRSISERGARRRPAVFTWQYTAACVLLIAAISYVEPIVGVIALLFFALMVLALNLIWWRRELLTRRKTRIDDGPC